MLRLRRLAQAAVALGIALAAPGVGAASYPPSLRFRSVVGARATVHYHQGLEPTARQAVSLADQILEALTARYGYGVPRVQIVLADVEDDPNGFATPFPFPLVSLRAAAPDGTDEFGNLEGWLRLVLTHELTHVVHLERARGLWGLGRKVFGRAPYLFPNALTPTWLVEGLATFEETEGTAFGRGRSANSRMLQRMAALEGGFPSDDQAVRGLDRWPSGQASYLFGESFLRQLDTRLGERTLPDLVRDRSGRVVPFLDDLSSKKVTGASFHERWKEWEARSREASEAEALRIEARGLTESRAVTASGVRQTSPRFSPDGRSIAYTSGTLDRFRAIRLVGADGSGDRRLADRNGGTGLAWTPDGGAIVFDQPEVHGTFEVRSDLLRVEVASGQVRRLTRGLRASDPDVAADAGEVVFVRRLGDRSDLFGVGLDGRRLRRITRSEVGTEWSGPRLSPDGTRIAAARFLPGGLLDVVLVDRETGEVSELTHDRAVDAEPTWTPDGGAVIFRSDRDGVSNLYSIGLADGGLRRVTNVVGGAFAPALSPDGSRLAFASYSARGYDVQVMALDLASAPAAAPFLDPYPEPKPTPQPAKVEDRGYSPLPALLPRFWSPVVAFDSVETQLGVMTSGVDPLLRHAYTLDLRFSDRTKRGSARAAYSYDRLRPTLFVGAEDSSEAQGDGYVRNRELAVGALVPIRRTPRSSQSASLTWRRKRETVVGAQQPGRLDQGGLEAAWVLANAKRYPYSISPVDGGRLKLAFLGEDESLGSQLSLGKLAADARAYLRAGGVGVLALHGAFGTTFGEPTFRGSFAVGGFPDSSLLDVVSTNLAVLRGYPDDAFRGRLFGNANLEWRVALAHPQRGWRTAPFFLRHLHGALFFDAGHAWSGAFRLAEVKTAVGAALGTDLNLAHALPVTFTAGVARSLAAPAQTRAYFRVGLAF